MHRTIYVIGHKNPDTDSIASAIASAELKRKQGHSTVRAAMAGEPNPQTRYILQRLGLETPLFLVEGKNELAHVMGYTQLEPHLYELKGVMSRKKQLVPHLLKVLGAL